MPAYASSPYQLTDFGLSTAWPSTKDVSSPYASNASMFDYMPDIATGAAAQGAEYYRPRNSASGYYNANTGMWESEETPVYNAKTGKWVSAKSGVSFTGVDPITGTRYSAGVKTGETVPYSGGKTINPNDPTQRYQSFQLTKDQTTGDEISALAAKVAAASKNTLDFNKLMSTVQSQKASADAASRLATDITGVSGAMRNYYGGLSGDLRQSQADYAALNERIGGDWQRLIGQAEGYLPMYDEANKRAQALALGNALRFEKAGLAGGDAYRQAGSYAQRLALANAANISVPLEQAKIDRRYANLNQYAMPGLQDMANRETTRIGSFNPQVAQQLYSAGQGTEQYLQQLATNAAAQQYQNARNSAMLELLPYTIQQQVLSGEISMEQVIQQMRAGNTNYGVQDIMGANVTPSTSTSFVSPGYPNAGRYSGGGGGGVNYPVNYGETMGSGTTGTGATQQNAPAGAYGDWVYDYGNKRWVNWKTGQVAQDANGTPLYTTNQFNQNDWVYNAQIGKWYNQKTGQTASGENPNAAPKGMYVDANGNPIS